MGSSRKWGNYAFSSDYESGRRKNNSEREEDGDGNEDRKKSSGTAENHAPCIDDFIIPQKVEAFAGFYENADDEGTETETFDDGRLRGFFKAYVTPCGDPLPRYLDMLNELGFHMRVSIMGEPAIIVRVKNAGI